LNWKSGDMSQAKVTTIFLWLWTWTGKAETKAPLFCPQRNWKGLSAYPDLWVGRYTLGPLWKVALPWRGKVVHVMILSIGNVALEISG